MNDTRSLLQVTDPTPWRALEPWVLAERYGDHLVGFWLLFRSGDRRLEIDVTKEQWDAFGS